MKTYCKFYKKTSQIIMGILSATICLIIPLTIELDTEMSTFEKLSIEILPFIGGIALYYSLLDLFADEPYIEITPTFIKIRGQKKLWWRDVTGIRKQELFLRNKKIEFLYFDLRNPLKYKKRFTKPVFQIQLSDLAEEDQKKLKIILREHFPINNIS